ncbi:MAG: rod-binding protein [bacterium]
MNNIEALPIDITTAASSINKKSTQDDKALKKACGEFEAYFVASMLKEMRRSVPEDGFFKKSEGEKIFQEMLDGQYAAKIAESKPLGIADLMYRQLSLPKVEKNQRGEG